MINLLQNSIKFSKANDKIRVEVSRTQPEENWYNFQVAVTDEGIGMSDADRQKLFTPFFKTTDK